MERRILTAVLAAVAGVLGAGCSEAPRATAARIGSREQLVGGRRALGDLGDYKLSNGIIHAIVQDKGHSRGFGAFGGSLIDVDLVRGGKQSSAVGVAGNDHFTEMFPAFFLQAIEPLDVQIAADGSNGPAIIRVSGRGTDFLSITEPLSKLVLSKPLDYRVDYILEPGKQYLKMVTTLTNPTGQGAVTFPLNVPFGFVTLLGEGQKLFVPGKAGFDMRFRLDDVYREPYPGGAWGLNAFPGEVASMVATEGAGVSYAVAASPRGATYMSAARKKDPLVYPEARSDSLLIPLASGSFLATYWSGPPVDSDGNTASLNPGESISYTGYLAVGSGDIASAQKIIYGISDEAGRQPAKVGSLGGRVREEKSGTWLADVSVVIQDSAGNYLSAARTLADGSWTASVPPGRYRAFAVDSVRTPTSSGEYVDVSENGRVAIDLTLERPAYLSARVVDETGRALPAKISIERSYENQGVESPRDFLYDLAIGERVRPSDLDPDAAEPDSRRYLERVFYAPRGTGGTSIRPGRYTVYASRGIEYELESLPDVELKSGEETQLVFTLNRVMSTPGYISCDLHVHSVNSVDSEMELPDRVASYAVEGVDFIASTDHNFISDFAPAVEALGIQDWLKTMVGIELTTLEMGHFNAYPLALDPGPVTHGSFQWFQRPPGELFTQLRCPKSENPACVGGPMGALVQVNHPRDSIIGYFNTFNLGAYTGTVLPQTGAFHSSIEPPWPYGPDDFSFDFDVLEVFNGKRLDLLHHYRIPEVPPPGPDPELPPCGAPEQLDCIPAPGGILEAAVKVDDPEHPGQTLDQAQPAFPGALDDFYNLVAKGRRFTAVGNSDSHGPSAEAGLPRTYLYVGDSADGSMRAFHEEAAIEALRQHRALVTNGPFIEVTVNDLPVGSEVVAPDGQVSVHVMVRAAPWIDVDRVIIKRGGKDQLKEPAVLETLPVLATGEVLRLDVTRTYSNFPDDSFIAVEASGDRSMWPVYTPHEVPPILINDAVGAIGATFGFADKYGRYRPNQIQQVTPFAATNPIWVVRSHKQALKASRAKSVPGASKPFVPRKIPDLRRLFGQLHADP